MLIFRRAKFKDLPGIMDVIHEAQAFMRTLDIDQWQDGYPDESIFREDIKIGQAYVCADDEGGKVASVAVFSLLPEPIYDNIEGAWKIEGKYLTIHRMAIGNENRGNGIAGMMFDRALQLARENNCASVRADTHQGNKAMRRFLEKNDFTYTGDVYYHVDAGDPLRVAYERPV